MMSDNSDHRSGLAEVGTEMLLGRLNPSLEMLAGVPFAIEGMDGRVISGHVFLPDEPSEKIPFMLEIEPLGYVRVPHGESLKGAAVASVIKILLQTRARLGAGNLHFETGADCEQWPAQDDTLHASEMRFRELPDEFEQRVKAQVDLLDQRQRQLYQAERLASIAQLAAGIAHEINNPIGFIRSNLETGRGYIEKIKKLEQFVPAGGEFEAEWRQSDLDFVLEDFGVLLAESVAGVDRIARIVKDLKGFSNVDQSDEENVDINTQLNTVLGVIAGQKPEAVEIITQYQDLPRLLCLPGLLNQVFVNILSNALHALEGRKTGGEIRVMTHLEDSSIVVDIMDNGCGIECDVLPHIFDPFFTTREVGKGSGLGLTVARDIVVAHGGSIDIASLSGLGTTVSVHLPF